MEQCIIDITDVLSPDLKSRSTVDDLLLFVRHKQQPKVKIDFSKVLFATRSFIDEYYNVFIKNNSATEGVEVQTVNVPADIQAIFNAVSKTQSGGMKPLDEKSTVVSFPTVKELNKYLSSLIM